MIGGENVAAQQARSRVYGWESALAERAVLLMTKLSQSVIQPYLMYGETAVLTQNSITPMDLENFRNDQDGVFLVHEVRPYTFPTVLTANTSRRLFDNISIQISDPQRRNKLFENPVALSVFGAKVSNQHMLARPYLLDRGAALLVVLTEENFNGTTFVYLAFAGEVVLGPMSYDEVREALLLGVYPLSGRQNSVWDHTSLVGALFSKKPPKLKGEADDRLDELRQQVVFLLDKFRRSRRTAYILSSVSENITASRTTALSRADLRNEQPGSFAVSRVRGTTYPFGAGGAIVVGPTENASWKIYATDDQVDLTRSRTDPLEICLFNRLTSAWAFHHPYVLRRNGSFQVDVTERVAGTPDAQVAFFGEVVVGMDYRELRRAITLGLYPITERGIDF